MIFKSLFILFSFIFFFCWGFGSYHLKIFPYQQIKNIVKNGEISDKTVNLEKHREWANNLVKGGYILHVRHAMREKWTDVTAYDAIELIGNVDARESTFSRAVCLTEKGIEDAKLLGKAFELAGVKISYVLSSPSCRSRETAIFAFKKINQIEPSILHRTAQKSSQHILMGRKLREELDKVKLNENENIVISGHAGTLDIDYGNGVGIVDVNNIGSMDQRLETGIVIIEKVGEKYIAQHKFNSIYEFVNNFFDLPEEDTSNGKFLFNRGFYSPENIKSGFIFDPNDTG